MPSLTDTIDSRYRLEQLIGRGGMSDVYAALDERSERRVAVKIVRSGDPELARRLAHEVKTLERFEHPGLIGLLDTGVSGDQAYLVMQLVDGPTLAEVIRDTPQSPAKTAAIGATVAEALAYVHAGGVVHRDVKPANILVAADGSAHLGDFGIARFVDATSMTLAGTTIGTVGYMAPEQLEDHQVGPAADIWALGIVLLECLTGRRIYEGSPSEVLARRLAGPVPLPPDLPVPWKLVLSGMLDHRPAQRLTASEAGALLRSSALHAPWIEAGAASMDAAATTALDLRALADGGGAGAAVAGAVLAGAGVAGAGAVLAGAGVAGAGAPFAGAGAAGPGAAGPGGFAPSGTAYAAPGTQPVGSRRVTSWATARRFMDRHGRALVGDRRVLLAGLVVLLILAAAGIALASSPTHSTVLSSKIKSSKGARFVSATAALAKLKRDVAADEAAGTVKGAAGQQISGQAQQAVTAETAGKPNQAVNDLQQAASAIAGGVQSGQVSARAGVVLQSDLRMLATALQLGAAATATTTTTTSTTTSTVPVTTVPPPTAPPPTSPPHGKHGHHGNDN